MACGREQVIIGQRPGSSCLIECRSAPSQVFVFHLPKRLSLKVASVTGGAAALVYLFALSHLGQIFGIGKVLRTTDGHRPVFSHSGECQGTDKQRRGKQTAPLQPDHAPDPGRTRMIAIMPLSSCPRMWQW